jgi:hypothetical protein
MGAVPLWLVGDNVALNERADQLIAVTTEQGCGGSGFLDNGIS